MPQLKPLWQLVRAFFVRTVGYVQRMHGFFHWQYSGGIIFALWAAVTVMVQFDDYVYAYIFASAAFLLAAGFIFTAVHITKGWVRFWGFAIVVVLLAGTCRWISSKKLQKLLTDHSGYLLPGNKPTPPNPCGQEAMSDGITVILGNAGAKTNVFPTTVISVHDKPLLTLDKSPDGKIFFSADIYDYDDNILASIEKSNYSLDSSVFKMTRKDLSSLSVVARKDKEEVLNIDYLNPHAVMITGIFRKSYMRVDVSKDAIVTDGNTYASGFCLSNTRGRVKSLFSFGHDRR